MKKWAHPTRAIPIALFLLLVLLLYLFKPTVDISQNNSRKTQHTIEAIETALTAFKKDTGRYPTSAEGIRSLLQNTDPPIVQWRGPYGSQIETDQWGHPFAYTNPHPKGNPYFITSGGPDNTFGTDDDITSN
jgi:general secretion pathway protein G